MWRAGCVSSLWQRLLASRLSACSADPSFIRLRHNLNVGKARLSEKAAMLINIQHFHSCFRGILFSQLRYDGVRPFINLRDDDELATRLQGSEYFAHIGG